MQRSVALGLACLVPFAIVGCGDDASGEGGEGGGSDTTTTSSSTSVASSSTGMAACSPTDTDLPEQDLGGGTDPEAGDFTMDEALAGLPEGPGPLRAIIATSMGEVTCELFPEIAPIGVANFVGLARGRRPFRQGGTWHLGRRYYDGLIFHRVIDDFMAQGGDPLGTGTGGPGYEFVNETDNMESHTPGTLAYANAGPDTNGSQFFIVAEEPATHLDGGYTIFGRCTPIAVVQSITEVPTGANDKPVEDVTMNTVSITRCAP
jgi:peptidyl-prolyl cis-trans isomerase A (cyclophilin A)